MKSSLERRIIKTFKILCEHNILPLRLQDNLVEMAHFRNKLVHGYLSIDGRFIFGILENELDLIKEVAELLIDKVDGIEKTSQKK